MDSEVFIFAFVYFGGADIVQTFIIVVLRNLFHSTIHDTDVNVSLHPIPRGS